MQVTLDQLDPINCTKQMSDKYVTMDTRALIENLLSLTSKGNPVFQLRSIQCGRKKGSNEPQVTKGRHVVRIQTVKSYIVGKEDGVHPELVITNSYDGSTTFKVQMGIFRLVCSNGLVIQTQDFGQINLRHMGTPAETAFDIVKQFAANLPKFQQIQNALIERKLTDEEMIEFAMKAAQVRFKNEFTEADAAILLEVTRPQDDGNDLWKVFNRCQEKIMAGGFKGENMKKRGKAIVRADEDLRINKELFELAMSFVNNDPESNPQPNAEVLVEVEPEALVPEIVDEVADLEVAVVDVLNVTEEEPAKMVKHPGTGRMIPNPLYNKWLRAAKAAGLV